jgi:hypothetical protein
MKVVGISVPKSTYKPGESVVATVTVQREIETGGVVYFYLRRSGQTWQADNVVTVGNTGLGIPDIFASGQLQKVTNTFVLPPDAMGNYQIGARERSETSVGVQGTVVFTVTPSTPSPGLVQTTATFIPNRTDVKDVVVFVDGTPVGNLAAWGFTTVLPAGKHTISAEGSEYATEPFPVTLTGGSTVKIPVVMLPRSLVKKSGSGYQFGLNITTLASIAAAAIGVWIVWYGNRRE